MKIAEQDILRALKATKPAKPTRTAAPKAPAKPKATKDATSTDGAPAPKQREGTRKATVITLLEREGGATLEEIMAETSWQKHYADVRIMPTCVGNPVCGGGDRCDGVGIISNV